MKEYQNAIEVIHAVLYPPGTWTTSDVKPHDYALMKLQVLVNKQKPIKPKIGGEGSTHYYVCGNKECDKPIDLSWKCCPYCETKIDWS